LPLEKLAQLLYHYHIKLRELLRTPDDPLKRKKRGSIPRDAPLSLVLTGATGAKVQAHFSQFKVEAVLPHFALTRVYFLDLFSNVPDQKGRFPLQLRDSCGKAIPRSPVGLKVRLIPLSPSPSPSSHSHSRSASKKSRKPVKCRTKARSSLDLYRVSFRAKYPGRYRIEVALGRRPGNLNQKDLARESTGSLLRWHRLPNHHVYVRNFW